MPDQETRHRHPSKHERQTKLETEQLRQEQLRLAQRVADVHELGQSRHAHIKFHNNAELDFDNYPIFQPPYPRVKYIGISPFTRVDIGHPKATTFDDMPYISITYIENKSTILLSNSAEAVAKIDEVLDELYPEQKAEREADARSTA